MNWNLHNTTAVLLAPAAMLVAGCGGRVTAGSLSSSGSAAELSIHAAATQIDTNGSTQFSATLTGGEAAKVTWSVSGGDARSGPGSITSEGRYTPPAYLTDDAVTVEVRATPAEEGSAGEGISELTVTPGFLQPLTPTNLSAGPGSSVTISGSITEVGGAAGIRFTLAREKTGAGALSEAYGTLSAPHCVRSAASGANPAYTACTVTYTAPPVMPGAGDVFVVGSVSTGKSGLSAKSTLSWTRVLLNSSGISSNPVSHQSHLAVPVLLGSSSGNNTDYDSALGQLSDCCGGTLGALLTDTSGTQYVLSNNHVLARSDQSTPGETIIQPGLIDNGCTPYGIGPGTTPVATLTGYPPLIVPATNVDAAIARVTPGAVDPKGNILELGAKQLDGVLAAAPPGISSTGGKGEAATLRMTVGKSGRTTGLTCGTVSALNVDVVVDYFTDCAETNHALSKTFTNQIVISGTSFSDAGDSGALIVDTSNAEPVGLFFAGGTDLNGVEQAVANPVGDVLAALDSQVAGPTGSTSFSFVGGPDHPVSCLNYDGSGLAAENTSASTSAFGLSAEERERAEAALLLAQPLANSGTGISRLGIGQSKDHPGDAAILLYQDSAAGSGASSLAPNAPAFINGIGTRLIASEITSAGASLPALRSGSFSAALVAKQRHSQALLKAFPELFGVGVGQSLDNPSEAAVMLFVDRNKVSNGALGSATNPLPRTLDGQRVRVVLMDRLHVTRSHGTPAHASSSCASSRRLTGVAEGWDGAFGAANRTGLVESEPTTPEE